MLKNFQDVLAAARDSHTTATISVAAAQDKDVLQAVKAAQELGLANAILVGDADAIRPLMDEVGLSPQTPVVHEADLSKAALKAAALVKEGRAQVLMKGLVNSSDFLRAVLDHEAGLRTGRLLSHLACLEIPGQEKLAFLSDGGMNIAPSLAEKKDILTNALLAMHNMGLDCPNVAVLAANEVVSPKMPATVDAQALVEINQAGGLPCCTLEGPIAMDVALSREAAAHKGIKSAIAGAVDLYLVPNIETGNIVSKALIYLAGAKMAGIVLGATKPVVMTSRAESPQGKLYSIALACLAANKNESGGE